MKIFRCKLHNFRSRRISLNRLCELYVILVWQQSQAVFKVSQVVYPQIDRVLNLRVSQEGLLIEIVQSF